MTRPSSCSGSSGRCRDRPEGTVNPDLGTGTIEVAAHTIEVLNRADPLPIPIDERVEADEALRLRYRYLDLRCRAAPSQPSAAGPREPGAAGAARRARVHRGRDPAADRVDPRGLPRLRVVPSRRHPGRFYALPQSPQLLKQLLMVAAWTATTRSPAASATRISAPTASSSSPSSTPR